MRPARSASVTTHGAIGGSAEPYHNGVCNFTSVTELDRSCQDLSLGSSLSSSPTPTSATQSSHTLVVNGVRRNTTSDSISPDSPELSTAETKGVGEDVRICVRGSVFFTTWATLTEREPDSRIANTLHSLSPVASRFSTDRAFPPSPARSPAMSRETCAQCSAHHTVRIVDLHPPTASPGPLGVRVVELHYDRSSTRFLLLLNYLRTGKLDARVERSPTVEIQELIAEATFFRCHGMVRLLQSVLCRQNSPFLTQRRNPNSTRTLTPPNNTLHKPALSPPPDPRPRAKTLEHLMPAHITTVNPLANHFPYLKELKGTDCGLWDRPRPGRISQPSKGDDEDLLFPLE